MRRWAVLCAWLLAASAFGAGKVVMVAPRASGDVLAPVVAALGESKGPEALVGEQLSPALKRLKLKPKDLTSEAKVMSLARELRANGFLVARPKGSGKSASLELTLYDTEGHTLWNATEKLVKGQLPEEAARRVAENVAGLLPGGEESRAAPRKDGGERVAAAPKPAAEEPGVEAPKELAPSVAPPSPKVATAPERPAPAVAEATTPAEVTATPAKAESEESAAIPLVELSAGAVALWRNQEFCPGVTRCGQKTLDPVQPIRYTTPAPYFGPSASAAVFPLARWSSPLRGLGVTGSYARGFLETVVPDATSGQRVSLPTYDEDFSAEVIYRLAFRWGWGEPSIGVRGGVQGRRFVLPANALVTESRRRTGPVFGAEAALPIWDPYVRLAVVARYAPAPLPAEAEREAYGGDAVTAMGLFASAGLEGQFEEGWGYVLRGEYAAFSDTFTGTGQRANGGAAHEEYLGLVGMVRYRF